MGLQVRIKEIHSQPEFNGAIGYLQDFDAVHGRWSVMLVGSTVAKLVKPNNLELLLEFVSDGSNILEHVGNPDIAASLKAETPAVQRQLLCKNLYKRVSKEVGIKA